MNQNPKLQILKAKKIISKVKKVEKIEYMWFWLIEFLIQSILEIKKKC